MIREIEVEGVGILRPCNEWQIARIYHMRDKENAKLAWMAFGLGMTVQQFKKLPLEKRQAAWEAHKKLTSPTNVGEPAASTQDADSSGSAAARDRAMLSGRRLTDDQKIALGRQLLQAKARLPHVTSDHGLPNMESARTGPIGA
jgi:hypothetical protein